MRQEAELVGAKASIPKQDVTGGCVYIVTQVARVNGPAVFERVRRKSLRARKRKEARHLLSWVVVKAKGRKEKDVADLKVTAMYMDVVIMADAMVDVMKSAHLNQCE